MAALQQHRGYLLCLLVPAFNEPGVQQTVTFGTETSSRCWCAGARARFCLAKDKPGRP